MVQFNIHSEIDIPASKQLLDQIRFAIACRQYPPGHRLPSTRQLAMVTGLHRNTISKVYRQLEDIGLVESFAGSGIYVKDQGYVGSTSDNSHLLQQHPKASKIIKSSVDDLLAQGFSLTQTRELLLEEIDWRLRCNQKLLISVPNRDLDAGNIMLNELEQSLSLPINLVPLEELTEILEESNFFGTVVTSRYFIGEVLDVVQSKPVRVIAIDIYDYHKELEIVKNLPKKSCLGLISLSSGTLEVAEIIVNSLRGEDLWIMTAQANNTYKVNALIRTAHTIICDTASFPLVKNAVAAIKEDLIRIPKLIRAQKYIGNKSINLLKKELGLGHDS